MEGISCAAIFAAEQDNLPQPILHGPLVTANSLPAANLTQQFNLIIENKYKTILIFAIPLSFCPSFLILSLRILFHHLFDLSVTLVPRRVDRGELAAASLAPETQTRIRLFNPLLNCSGSGSLSQGGGGGFPFSPVSAFEAIFALQLLTKCY